MMKNSPSSPGNIPTGGVEDALRRHEKRLDQAKDQAIVDQLLRDMAWAVQEIQKENLTPAGKALAVKELLGLAEDKLKRVKIPGLEEIEIRAQPLSRQRRTPD